MIKTMPLNSSLPKLGQGESERALIQGPAGALEYRLEMPKQAPQALALICHPHPLYQGSMDNKVVYSLSRAALALGCVALRFQFRGVGGSEGTHDNGEGEAEDVAFLLRQLQQTWPDLPVFLMGFSFGSYMALKVAAQQPVKGLVAIAPPLAYAKSAAVPEPLSPWLVIHGTGDDVVPYTDTVSRIHSMQRQPDLITMEDVGHFFHGELTALRRDVEAWLSEQLGN